MESLKLRGFICKSKEIKEKCSWKDRLFGAGIVMVLSFFFYRSIWSLPFLIPVYFLYQREAQKDYIQKCHRETAVQFKDAHLWERKHNMQRAVYHDFGNGEQ